MSSYTQPEVIVPSNVAAPPEPYSHGIRWADLIFVAGQVSVDQDGIIVGDGDPNLQAEQVWENITRVVEASGGNVENVIKITVFLKDIRHAPAEIAVRERIFATGRYPICTQVQVANLGWPELLMEVDAIAVATQ